MKNDSTVEDKDFPAENTNNGIITLMQLKSALSNVSNVRGVIS